MADDVVTDLLEAQDTERRCIARMLHDVIGQSMSRVLLELEMLDRGTGDETEATLGSIQARIGEVVEDMGSLARHLVSAPVAGEDLEKVFEGYAHDFERVHGLPVRVATRVALSGTPWPDPVMRAALRAVRATLLQLAIPGGAAHATVSVEAYGVPELCLWVAFEVAQGAETRSGPRMATLQEVLAASGGQAKARTERGVTVVELRLPWREGADRPVGGGP